MFPWLTTLGLIPLVGSAAVALLPKGRDLLAKQLALGVSLLSLLISLLMLTGFKTNTGTLQLVESHDWISTFGIKYAVGVDGIALMMVLLATILAPIVILGSWNEAENGRFSVKTFFALLLMLETFMVGVFSATDVFLFYVFFEAMLIPVYFLIGSFGGAQRSYAAVKFLLYSLFGGLLMLAAVIALYVISKDQLGAPTFDITALTKLHFGALTERWLFLGFFIAFAIKAPLWPFHTWLPDAASAATPGTAVLLVGVLDKVGTFGMLRYCLPLFPGAAKYFTPLIIVLSVISVVYGALLAIGQTDIKRLIAFTSISHFGFITLGIFAMTSQGQSGATLYMVNHGFSTAALFLIAGWMISRRNSSTISDFGGLQRVTPVMAWTFFLAGLSALALPGMSSFVSEFLVLVGTYTRYPWAAIIATGGIILAALYVLILIQRTMHGPVTAGNENLPDLTLREKLAIAPVIAIIIFLGFYPKPILDVVNPSVAHTMQVVGVTDPAPTGGK
ncbi:MAG TPA: NADH-quinone oxidoreductase subunit M [Candidatus Nanopelagicaceae bacterium]|nr:NADH-quinone oxidoreductase subunit M [Candidatus Nanopelagicaceae bacterium]